MSPITSSQVDFELEQYLLELFHEVNSLVYSDEDGASKEDKFTEHVMEVLAEASETEGIRLCHYEKENRWENIQTKINGYAIEEGLETLDIFISHYEDRKDLYKIGKGDFDKLLKWPIDFLNSALKGHLDQIEPSSEAFNLAKLIRDNRREFIRINIFILSNGNISHDPPKNYAIKGNEEIVLNFQIWDVERLHRLSRSRNNREPIEIDFEGILGTTINCLSMPSRNDLYECYLAIVPGKLLATLYRNYGTRLLESNVRAFLQQTGKVNRGIRDTIRNNPHMFLPYNNGLATTAQEVTTRKDDHGQLVITAVKDFQVVNGGQTTASLFHTEKKHKADLSEVFVQMKLTVIKDEEQKEKTVPFISRFANSQNKVSELDLTSNNPFLQRIEELSRVTYATDPTDHNLQTLWFFERVKGQYREALNKEPTKGKKDAFKLKHPRSQVIIKSEIAKVMNIWNLQPHHVSKGSQKNYNYFLKDIEDQFKKKKPNQVFWQDIVANTILFKTADKLFGRKNNNPIGDTNIKSYTVSYALSYLHFITNNRINLGAIWSKQQVDEPLIREIRKGLIFTYKFLDSLDVALVSEAAKSEKTWKELKSKPHPFNEKVLEKYYISDEDSKSRYKETNDNLEESKKYNNLEKITTLGIRFWDGLGKYNSQEALLSDYQATFLDRILKKIKATGQLSDMEIKKGVQMIDLLKKHNLTVDQISSLSKLSEKEIVNPSDVFGRLSRLTEDDWKRILALGEQTGTLGMNEISVLKTVRTRLRRKEDIDLKRMQSAEKALKKLRRFNIKF